MNFIEYLQHPWPWYVSGPLIGLTVPLFVFLGNRGPGISSSLRDACSIVLPRGMNPFALRGRPEPWNLLFAAGIVLGAFIAITTLYGGIESDISEETKLDLVHIGVTEFDGLLPGSIFAISASTSISSYLYVIVGGLLVGFGTRLARGCTSGHTITGLSTLQWPSLVATLAFFAGGLLSTHFILPIFFRVGSYL